jgi:hypothetical protein
MTLTLYVRTTGKDTMFFIDGGNDVAYFGNTAGTAATNPVLVTESTAYGDHALVIQCQDGTNNPRLFISGEDYGMLIRNTYQAGSARTVKFQSVSTIAFQYDTYSFVVNPDQEAGVDFKVSTADNEYAIATDGEYNRIGLLSAPVGSHQIHFEPDLDTVDSIGLYIEPDWKTVSANESNLQEVFRIRGTNWGVGSGYTDSGARYGIRLDSHTVSGTFQGTLDRQYGIYLYHGTNGTSPTGTLNESYGLFVSGLYGANSSIGTSYGVYITSVETDGDQWGIYQNQSFIRNYFSGAVGIGTGPTGGKLHVLHSTVDEWAGYIYNNYNGAGKGLVVLAGDGSSDTPILRCMDRSTNTKFTVQDDGHVGINITSPANALHVYHATENQVARFQSGDPVAVITFQDSTTTAVPYLGASANTFILYAGDPSSNIMSADEGDVIFNPGTGDVNFKVGSENYAAAFYVDADKDEVHFFTGGSSESTRVYIYGDINTYTDATVFAIDNYFMTVSSNGTNYQKGVYVTPYAGSCDIASGVTDSGYRMAADFSNYYSHADFEGTLGASYAIWARAGTYGANPTGTINNCYVINVDGIWGTNATIGTKFVGVYIAMDDPGNTETYGIYQGGYGKNYFAGSVGIGTPSPDATLHVFDGNTGVVPHSFSQIVVENTTHNAISLITANDQNSYFMFGDEDDAYIGGIGYAHVSDYMWLYVGNNTVMSFTASTVTVNEDGDDVDFRVESTSIDNIFFVDAGVDSIFMGNPGGYYDDNGVPIHMQVSSTDAVPDSSDSLFDSSYGLDGHTVAQFENLNAAAVTTGVAFRTRQSAAAAGWMGLDWVSNYTGRFLFRLRNSGGTGSKEYFRMQSDVGTVFNEGGDDLDFRVESDGNANMLTVDAGANQVLIGTSTALASTERIGLHVLEGIAFRGNLGGADISDKAGAGGCVMGWNYTSGVGETDFIAYKGGGSRGGFMFWDYAAGSMVQLLNMHDAESVFNDTGEDIDFRVESDSNTHMLFVDGGEDTVGIGADCSTRTGYNTELIVAGSDYAVATFVGTGSSLAGATVYLCHESASPADNDLAGTIYFCSYNDDTPLADMVAFGEITVQSTDVSDGNEHGRMVFYTMVGGVSTECITIAPTSFGPTNGVVINEGGDVAISFRVETPNYSNALLVEAGGETLNSQLVYGANVSGRDVYISSLGQFGYYSSMRWHKENIEPINRNVLERLQDVEVVQFNNTLADGEFQYGMIAEDLQYVIPELTWFDDDREPAGVDYKGFVPLLIAKEQEHEVEIRRLRRRVAELEQRLAA